MSNWRRFEYINYQNYQFQFFKKSNVAAISSTYKLGLISRFRFTLIFDENLKLLIY